MSSHHSSHAITWHGPEFLYKRKTLIWYTNIFVFFFFVFLLFFLLKNYLAIAIVSALCWYAITRAEDHPRTIAYKIDNHGISVGPRKISYGELHSFSVDTSNSLPVIVLDTNAALEMPVTMVIKKSELDEIVDRLSQQVPMENKLSFIYWLTHKLHY